MNIGIVKLKIGNMLNNIINTALLRWYKISIPVDLKINGLLRLAKSRNHGDIIIGKNVVINSSWKSNPSGGGQTRTLFTVGKNGKLIIGNNCGISNSTIVCQNSVVLEDNVNIGVNSVIYDTDMHSVEYEYRISRQDEHIKISPVVIKEGAWIGGHSIILKGVTIGCHSVIAAGSVVSKDIPNNELWGGNPAKKIRDIGSVQNDNEEISKKNINF